MSGHEIGQIGVYDRDGFRTHAPPGDVCLDCSDATVGRWVPVVDCPDALAEWERQRAEYERAVE